MFAGKLGKQMMIQQGYVPQTCTLPDEIAGPLIWQEVNARRNPCHGCHHARSVCRGQSKQHAERGGGDDA